MAHEGHAIRDTTQMLRSTPGMDVPSSPEPMSPYAGYKASYDTMSTPEGGSDGQAPYSTNPTTANSSFENFPGRPANAPQPSVETYGMNGFGHNGFHPGTINKPAEPRQIIKLGGSGDANSPTAPSPMSPVSPSSPEKKRRSWLTRRFSKNA
ncbi:MAG: hypothetical protein Q9227_002469 [Pyrenula ochraceoflavens]